MMNRRHALKAFAAAALCPLCPTSGFAADAAPPDGIFVVAQADKTHTEDQPATDNQPDLVSKRPMGVGC